MVIDGDFNSDKWKSWITKLAELKPFYNADTNSILLADGLAQFEDGQAAMVFGVARLPADDQVDVRGRQGRRRDEGPHLLRERPRRPDPTVDTPGFQVTKFSTNKELAGNFMAFLHARALECAL